MPPITPDKIVKPIPEEVFEAFNELIAKDYDGREATVYLKEARNLASSKLKAAGKELQDWMLDIEDSYRKTKKWIVVYDSPSIGDNYEAYYTFKKKG